MLVENGDESYGIPRFEYIFGLSEMANLNMKTTPRTKSP